ncbi:MAG: C39 family peptidase [Clostridiaceae bacterium]
MGKLFRFSIFCILIILLLKPTFNFVNSGGNKEGNLKYTRESKSVDSTETENIVNKSTEGKNKEVIDVPLIEQLPGLINGCEVTSLAMMVNYYGEDVTKETLVKEVKKDKTPLVKNSAGEITKWGDPNYGFVGDIEGDDGYGYAIYPSALLPLANKYLDNKAVDLTGETTDTLTKYLSNEKPILVWVTSDFTIPEDFITWKKGNKEIKATFSEHCIILTGYDDENFYYNDPLNVGKDKSIDKETFEKVWEAMGKMALSYD